VTDGVSEECIEFWSRNLKGRDDFENLDIDGRILLKLILMKRGVRGRFIISG
jgi:hypothetical protein